MSLRTFQFCYVREPTMLLLFLFNLATVSAFFHPYQKTNSVLGSGGDVGDKLLLTPYIKSGRIEEARNLAFVPPLKGNVTSYSGFLTVDEKCDSNMFFWFFPAETSVDTAPVTVWLQGGPGASSLYGLFSENGPYELTPSDKIKLRKYTWTQVTSLIFIDNPVGTGYSYTKNCYSETEEEVGANLLKAIKQIFKLFPNLRLNPFFITGESYAGKYVPAFAYAIHKDADTKEKINLQGLAIGNGYIDPINQLDYSDYLYQLGLFDERARKFGAGVEAQCKSLIANQKWVEAFHCTDEYILGDLTKNVTFFKNVTGFDAYFNYLYPGDEPEGNLTAFITKNEVRKSIHVGNATWNNGTVVHEHLLEDSSRSVAPWLAELLEHYRVVIYNGQLDIIVAYPLTENFLKNLKWSAADKYKNAGRWIWRVDKEIAGYYKTAGKLTEVLVRNAGHMVPMNQPKWAFDLISRFINNKPF